jgi:Mrp family chromosome partitioning ATPase
LDAAVAPPVPKPHATFTPAPVEAPAAKSSKPAPPPPAPKPAVEEPPPAAVETKSEGAPLGLLQPAWEVDRFQWPEHCKLLLNTESEYLADVGKRLASAAQDGLNILAITSTRRGEGRTTLALCLARAAAQAGVKVALVDADMENPQLINELGVEATCGWQDVVLGTQPLAEAAIVSLEDRFTFFPWTPGGALKSLNDPRATRVLREIAKAYSLVVIDLGPVPGRETRMFEDGAACPIDAAILVRDVRWTSPPEAQRVAAQLTDAGVESVGIAENFGPKRVATP